MSLFIYCPRRSQGALELVKALGATRLRKFDGMDFWDQRKRFDLKEGDVIVAWGSQLPELEGVRVLNSVEKWIDKNQELTHLMSAGINTIRPYKTAPPLPKDMILPRVADHMGGMDLLHSPKHPDYYVVKENFVREYRIHSFNGKSIRAGVKIPRDGFTSVTEAEWKPNSNLVHPWIRSYDGGWRVNYEGFKSTAKLRRIAHEAVKALGLTFGAVDIGETSQGVLKVLEVNRAPGIENNTVAAYVRAINRWISGVPAEQPVGESVSEDGS